MLVKSDVNLYHVIEGRFRQRDGFYEGKYKVIEDMTPLDVLKSMGRQIPGVLLKNKYEELL